MLTLSSLGGCSGGACGLCLPAVLSDSVAAALGAQYPQYPAAPVAQHQENVAMGTGIPTTEFCLGNLMQLLWQPGDGIGRLSALDGHRNACPGQPTVLTGQFGTGQITIGQPSALDGQPIASLGQPTTVTGQLGSLVLDLNHLLLALGYLMLAVGRSEQPLDKPRALDGHPSVSPGQCSNFAGQLDPTTRQQLPTIDNPVLSLGS